MITNKSNATIPELSALGLALPSEAGYRWQVLGVGGFTDTDSTAGQNGVFDAIDYNSSRRKRLSVWRNYGISGIRNSRPPIAPGLWRGDGSLLPVMRSEVRRVGQRPARRQTPA